MCGIAGYIKKDDRHDFDFRRMVDVMSHRGPDDSGTWHEDVNGTGVYLGHRRLSIIDLSAGGHQPMVSACGRYVLVYNGELYNYKELKAELEAAGTTFKSQSDTEVFLQGLITWGPDALARYNGMWGFAFYDRRTGDLLIGRDRFGKKPLYYHEDDSALLFASEIKAILIAAAKKFRLNPNVVKRYLEQNLMDVDEDTFFEGIHKIPPGHTGLFNVKSNQPIAFHKYWHITDEEPFDGSENQIIERVRELFFDAVSIRLRSDVPVGVLLSGGLDSSAIVAGVKQLQKNQDIVILSSTSRDKRFDESAFIDDVADHLDLPVQKFSFDNDFQDVLGLLSTVVWHHDEPICNFSILAHYLLMQKAKEYGVTVLLNGQGADEILCGYKKYFGFYLQSLLRAGYYLEFIRSLYSLSKQGTVLNQLSLSEAKRYVGFLSAGKVSILADALSQQAIADKISLGLNGGSVIERQIADVYRFSVPVITHYEDRNSMAFAREIRLPFLDYRLVSLLVQLPVHYKLRDGWTKWILRKAMQPYLPETITWRKDKQHFVNAGGEMLKQSLKQKIEAYLTPDSLMYRLGLVDRDNFMGLYQRFSEQPADKGNISFKDIFTPLALEVWLRRFEEYIQPSI